MAFDQRLLEARLALHMIGPEELPNTAADALEAGLDGPSIRRLAALLKPSGWETDQILPGFMAEAGLNGITKSEAAVRLAAHIAHRILDHGLDPLQHTRDFEHLWIQADYPTEVRDLGTLDDEKYVSECMGRSEDEFRQYARSVLMACIEMEKSAEKS